MTPVEKLPRVPAWAWALLFAAVMCLPRLGSFGFWDPWEVKIAEEARAVVKAGLGDGAGYPAKPPLTTFLQALGFSLFGASELGGRLFISLSAIGALMATYWAGLGLFRRRSALLGALVLGTMTMFVLEARQITSDMPLIAALALAMGGLGRYAWPESGKRRARDLALAAAGVILGYLGGGALIGVVLPGIALLAALVVGYGLQVGPPETAGPTGLSPGGAGPDIPAGTRLGTSLLRGGSLAAVLVVAVATVLLFVLTLTTATVSGKYSPLLGGAPRGGTPAQMFEVLVRQLGFGLFPWSGLAVFALGRPLIRLDDDAARTEGRLAFGQLYLLLFTAFGFALSTYTVLMVGDARFVALAPIALSIGVLLDEALDGHRPEPVLGLLAAVGTIVVSRDFFLAPEELVSVHLLAKVKWPPSVSVGYGIMAIGVLVGLGLYTGLAARGRAIGTVPGRDLTTARPWQRRLEGFILQAGRWGIHAAVAAGIGFSLFLSQYLVPTLSKHFSFKPVLESYARFAKGGEEIGKYKVEGQGAGFYGSQAMTEIPSQDKLLEFLRKPARVFALTSADELAALDSAFKVAQIPYFVVDASSSRFLLLSNQLGSSETDENPLKKNVWMPPAPKEGTAMHEGQIGEETQPPWKWRLPASAVFDGKIELLGADMPTSMRRPGKLPVTLYFKVLVRPPPGYKIFIHFDAPGAPRLNGDHAPLNGAFPTSYWLPGEYIRDEFEVDVPLMTTPAGTYTVLVGFWPGGEGRRMKVTTGAHDGVDRVRVGTVEIK